MQSLTASVLVLAGVIVLEGCGHQGRSAGGSAPDDYFAPGTLAATCPGFPAVTAFSFGEASRYAALWSSLGEPSLLLRNPARSAPAAYRFTRMASHGKPLAIRIVAQVDGGFRLTGKRQFARDGERIIVQSTDRALNETEAASLRSALGRAQIAQLVVDDCRIGNDGEDWLFEAAEGGRVHVLKRWSPQEGPMLELGRLFLGLSGWTSDAAP